jgi:hypothetical protein
MTNPDGGRRRNKNEQDTTSLLKEIINILNRSKTFKCPDKPTPPPPIPDVPIPFGPISKPLTRDELHKKEIEEIKLIRDLRIEDLEEKLEWSLNHLSKLVSFSDDGSAYVRCFDTPMELAGFKRKFNQAKAVLLGHNPDLDWD